MLNTAHEPEYRPAAPDPARLAAHSDAALYFGCPDVDKAYRELRAMGVDVKEPAVAPYGMKQLYLKDPDGYERTLLPVESMIFTLDEAPEAEFPR